MTGHTSPGRSCSGDIERASPASAARGQISDKVSGLNPVEERSLLHKIFDPKIPGFFQTPRARATLKEGKCPSLSNNEISTILRETRNKKARCLLSYLKSSKLRESLRCKVKKTYVPLFCKETVPRLLAVLCLATRRLVVGTIIHSRSAKHILANKGFIHGAGHDLFHSSSKMITQDGYMLLHAEPTISNRSEVYNQLSNYIS